jgi:hypothetical protein
MVAGCARTAADAPAVPLSPVLAAWTKRVVDAVTATPARAKLAEVQWPKDMRDSHALSVVNGRLFCDVKDANSYSFAERVGELRPLGGVATGRVPYSQYCLMPDGEVVFVAFYGRYDGTVQALFRLKGESLSEAVSPDRVPVLTKGHMSALGREYEPRTEQKGFVGPITVLDASGGVRARADLPPDWGVVGYMHRPLKAVPDGFLVCLPVFRKADFPTGLPAEAPPTDLLLMHLKSDGTGDTRHVSARAKPLQLVPDVEPYRAELTAAAFLGDSVDDRLALRRLAWYQRPGEDLYTIELWDFKPDDTAQLIDLIAWYNGPDGMAFEYRVGPDGTIQETPTKIKTSFNFIWPLAPEPYGPNEIVYPHLDGIWKATLP